MNVFNSFAANRDMMHELTNNVEKEERLRVMGKSFFALRDWATDRDIQRSVS